MSRAGFTCTWLFSTLLLVSLSPFAAFGQQVKNDDHYGKVGLGFSLHSAGYFQGYSYAGKKKAGPTYSFSADVKLGPVISLGLLAAYTQGKLFIEDAARRNYPVKLE